MEMAVLHYLREGFKISDSELQLLYLDAYTSGVTILGL